jgi:hypothetical protein
MLSFAGTSKGSASVAERIAVIVPGMMGSTLRYRDGTGRIQELWGENLLDNYLRLINNNVILKLDPRQSPTECALLETFYIHRVMRHMKRLRIWKATLDYLAAHQEFGRPQRLLKYGYDWRRSLIDMAPRLAADVNNHVGQVAQLEGRSRSDYNLIFITHSMGGLLTRVAIGSGILDPGTIDKLIHIGSPLQGAPAAFVTAFKGPQLPLLHNLMATFHRKNAAVFWDALVENLRSFPSAYQLMPPKPHQYVHYSDRDRVNPLDEPFIDASLRQAADDAHARLRQADIILSATPQKVITIYCGFHPQKKTILFVRVKSISQPNPTYIIEEIIGETQCGDATVPEWSAAGFPTFNGQERLLNVEHAFMCNDPQVVSVLRRYV